MTPIRSRRREQGVTLIELMLVVSLSFIVILGAGAIYRGVDRSFRDGALKMAGRQNASFLSTMVSRRVRVAADYRIYESSNPRRDTDTGNALSLLDENGLEFDRLVWDSTDTALEDSTGVRVGPPNVLTFVFTADPNSDDAVLFSYRTTDDTGATTDVETAATLRN